MHFGVTDCSWDNNTWTTEPCCVTAVPFPILSTVFCAPWIQMSSTIIARGYTACPAMNCECYECVWFHSISAIIQWSIYLHPKKNLLLRCCCKHTGLESRVFCFFGFFFVLFFVLIQTLLVATVPADRQSGYFQLTCFYLNISDEFYFRKIAQFWR